MNSKRRIGRKKPGEHWLKSMNKEDQVRLMILEGYTVKDIVLCANVKEDFIENIADKYELHVRHKGAGDRAYWDYITNRQRSDY